MDRGRITVVLLVALVLGSAYLLWTPQAVSAGIYNADTDVAYKEYWIPHSQFTGGHTNPGCIDTNPPGTFYLEPTGNCTKTLSFTIHEDLARATKAEIYIDLWRNHAPRYASDGTLTRKASAIFRINDHNTWFETHPTGADWSRTPLIADTLRTTDDSGNVNPSSIRSLLSLLQTGQNTILLRRSTGLYHIHDIAIRIYFDPDSPLLDGSGQPIAVPNGELLTIEADNGVFNANAVGNLTVNTDRLKLKANVTTAAQFVEFHGYYRGYDLDNDDIDGDLGAFDPEWHNRGRNDWHPGGRFAQAEGGTIDHIGTQLTPSPGEYEIEWDLAHVVSQSGVKFKLRIVNAEGVVREAAGGISAPFALQRPNTVVMAVAQTDWQDLVLHHGGSEPITVTRTVFLPCDLITTNWNSAYVLGSYWLNPFLSINGNTSSRVFTGGQDLWTLSRRVFSTSHFVAGENNFTYSLAGNPETTFGQFVEKPGPMVVFKRNTALPADNTAPQISERTPAPGATNVVLNTKVMITLADNSGGQGIDLNRLKLFVNGKEVAPQLSCSGSDHILTYTPPGNWPNNVTVDVRVEACDLAGNCISQIDGSHSFNTRLSQHAVTTGNVGQGSVQVTPSKTNYSYGETITVAATPANGWSFTTWTLVFNGWEDAQRDYRVPLQVGANGVPRVDRPLETVLNFTSLFAAVGQPNTFDPHSLRVLQVDSTGQVLDSNVPFVFYPASDYHATTNAAGTLVFHLKNSMAATGVRYYHIYFDVAGKGFSPPSAYNPPSQAQATGKDALLWLGGPQSRSVGVDSTNPNLSLKVTGPVALTANFAPATNYTLSTTVAGNGTVTKNPDLPSYLPNDEVMVSAIAADGWRFVGWSGSATGSEPVLNLIMDGHKSLTATFQQIFNLTVNQIGQGQITLSPQQAEYLDGEQVTLTATAADGWYFAGWTGDVVSTATPLLVTIDSNKTVTATFLPLNTLTVNVVGAGGEVQITPQKPAYMAGEVVTLTAITEPGWTFMGWSGASSATTPTMAVTMDSSKAITATFVRDEYTLAITVPTGGGSVKREPAKEKYFYDDEVTVTAEPDAGWVFTGWSGALDGDANPQSLLITGDTTLQATFAQTPYTIISNVIGSGSITLAPNQEFYHLGAEVTVTALPNPGWTFAGWSGDLDGANGQTTLTVNGNKNVTATFVPLAPTLSINSNGNGTVTVSPLKETYQYKEQVTLTATAGEGWLFTGWSGDLSGDATPVTIELDSNKSIVANFAQTTGTLATQVVGQGQVQIKPVKTVYATGEEVELLAVPDLDWLFTGWSGDLSGDANPAILEINGNKSVTATFTEQTLFGGELQSDDFNHCAYSTNVWTWIDPLGDAPPPQMTGEEIRLSVPGGVPHDLWRNGIEAPHLVQQVDDQDFEVMAQFNTGVSERIQLQGLLFKEDESRALRVNFQREGSTTYFFVGVLRGTQTPQARAKVAVAGEAPLGLRVQRVGDNWTFWYRTGDGEWETEDALTFTHRLVVNQVGPFVGNASVSGKPAPAHTAVVDYFVNLAKPLPADDPRANILPTEVVGQGEVTRNVDCGNPVELTAAPAAGWRFIRWDEHTPQGVRSLGDANPLTILFRKGVTVTAVFAEVLYEVKVTVAGQGTVSKQPDKERYSPGEVVTLTAQAQPGWVFSGWSGAATGAQPQVQVTAEQDLSVQATFVPESQSLFTLTTAVVGNGSVTLTPQQDHYQPGEVVTVTATAGPGWLFLEWSGDLSSAENPQSLAVDANKNITAHFGASTAGFIVASPNGQVTVTPVKEIYQVGDEVALTAAPNEGWEFVEWQVHGAVTAAAPGTTDNPLAIIIDGHKTYEPRFREQASAGSNIVYLPVVSQP